MSALLTHKLDSNAGGKEAIEVGSRAEDYIFSWSMWIGREATASNVHGLQSKRNADDVDVDPIGTCVGCTTGCSSLLIHIYL